MSEAEKATGDRLSRKLNEPLYQSEHVGAEYVDEFGRTYDAMGTPEASRFWNAAKFFESIDRHLLKSNDFTVIDLTDFTPGQKAAVGSYLDTLSSAARARVIRIGF